jgi:hypothetical protein
MSTESADVLLPATVMNVAAALDPKEIEGIPVGGFSFDGMTILERTVINCSETSTPPSVPVLSLTFHFDPHTIPPALAQDVQRFLETLYACDQANGGAGLSLDRYRSQVGNGTFTILLRPNERKKAWQRFSEITEQLGIPVATGCNGTPAQPPVPVLTAALADVIAQFERQHLSENWMSGNGSSAAPDLTAARRQVQSYRVCYELAPDAG